jgi:Pyruvate/2-oxoacid:ferredoxin oxidoreductase gamma subunit
MPDAASYGNDPYSLYNYLCGPSGQGLSKIQGGRLVFFGPYTEFADDELKEDGLLIYERDLVHPAFKKGQQAFGIPSTRIAESLGRTIIQNIVMLGFFAAVVKLVPREAMRDAVKDSVPAGTEDLNLKAFDSGWAYYEEEYGEAKEEKNKKGVAAAGSGE